jgi:hypothetical protein
MREVAVAVPVGDGRVAWIRGALGRQVSRIGHRLHVREGDLAEINDPRLELTATVGDDLVAAEGEVPLEIGTRLITEGGQAVRVQGIGRDVTERRQAEAAVEDANRKLTDWVNELEERGRQATCTAK